MDIFTSQKSTGGLFFKFWGTSWRQAVLWLTLIVVSNSYGRVFYDPDAILFLTVCEGYAIIRKSAHLFLVFIYPYCLL